MKKLKNHLGRNQIGRIIIFSFLCFFAQNSQNSFASNRNLTIFAEQSMVQALTKIATLYSQKNNVTVSINFNSSFELINDIDMGEPADVFISAHSGLIDILKQKGLVDIYNISYIARDRLNLVTSKNNPNIDIRLFKTIKLKDSLRILDEIKATVIIDKEESTSGLHSNLLIQSLPPTGVKLFQKLPEDRAAIFNIIHNSPENYAVLLASQIKNKKDLLVLAASKEDDIFYQALVIAGNNMKISREFLKFLKSNEAIKILQENSFIVD